MIQELTEGTTYYMEVRGYNHQVTGDYSFHVEGPGAGTVSDDHGFSPWSATWVVWGCEKFGAVDIGDDKDYFV